MKEEIPTQKWEYWQMSSYGGHIKGRMNDAGEKGWECYAVTKETDNEGFLYTHYYFKRLKD